MTTMLRAFRLRRMAEISEQFFKKREAYYELIGRLYPSMVYNELCKLKHEYESLGGATMLVMPDTPREDGSAPPRPFNVPLVRSINSTSPTIHSGAAEITTSHVTWGER